jgi:hypothetical protein
MSALEPEEVADVETRLKHDPELARTCELLRRSLEPLDDDRETFAPPPQLAARTCTWVAERATVRVVPETVGGSKRWSFNDMFVTAGTMAAAAMLFFPAINFSRDQAQTAYCQNQLRQIGLALMNYSERFPPFLPVIPEQGPLAASGGYAPALVDTQLINDHSTFLCPGDPKIHQANFRVPSSREVASQEGEALKQTQATMGGSYGITFGHLEENKYQPTRDLGQHCFALVTDLPSTDQPGHQTTHHGGKGQNTLFGDFHVKLLKTCKCDVDTLGDDIFLNDAGILGPGLDAEDSVIGNGAYVSPAMLQTTQP